MTHERFYFKADRSSHCAVAIFTAVLAGLAGRVEAQTPTAVIPCNPCGNSIADFTSAAYRYGLAYGWPIGTVALVVSQNKPISVRVRWVVNPLGLGFSYFVVPLDVTLAAGHDLDERMFGHRIKATHLNMPITSSPENIVDAFNSRFVYEYENVGPWLNIPNGPPTMGYTFADLGNKDQPVTFYLHDQVIISYTNGDSEIWQIAGLIFNFRTQRYYLQLQRIPGTQLHNGRPPAPPNPAPAKPVRGFGGVDTTDTTGTTLGLHWDLVSCWGTASVTVTSPDGSGEVTGWSTFDCP
jgi:hypothetical protein